MSQKRLPCLRSSVGKKSKAKKNLLKRRMTDIDGMIDAKKMKTIHDCL
jgi:hypothetical protein